MPSVVVRPFEERDEHGFSAVRGLTYNNGDTSPRETRYDVVEDYVAEADGEIVGAFTILPMTASRGPAVLTCGAVAGVAVAPDFRRGGVGSAMMSWYVSHARKTGVRLASLYAFREQFYRKFGYEVVGKRVRIVAPVGRIPVLPGDLPIRRLGWEDYRQLEPCYQAFAHSHSGLNLRQVDWQWKRVLAEHKPLTIYAFGDPVHAYVAISHQSAFWSEQSVSEFVWSTREGYLSALNFLRQLGMNKTTMAWFEPSDSPYYAQFLDQGVEARIERAVMFRVCDVAGALRDLRPTGSGSFVIQVDDPIDAENDGAWQVTYSPSGVTVEKGGEADLRLSIQSFTQAFMGEPSLEELIRHGVVEVRNSSAVAAATGLLTPSPTVCMDFF